MQRHPEHVPGFVERLRTIGWARSHEFLQHRLQGHPHRRWLMGMLNRRMSPCELLSGKKTGRKPTDRIIVLKDKPKQRLITEFFKVKPK